MASNKVCGGLDFENLPNNIEEFDVSRRLVKRLFVTANGEELADLAASKKFNAEQCLEFNIGGRNRVLMKGKGRTNQIAVARQ